ncbi:unnamed protein product, partial [Coregonus sp. 'balchen']
MSCSCSGSSPLSYRWLNGSSEVTARDGVQLGDRGCILTIVSVTQYDRGLFMCIVSNPINSFCHGDLLPAGPLNGALGENMTFNVTLSPPEPPKAVTWSFGVNIIIILSGGTETVFGDYKGRITLSRTTGSLELRNLSLDDSGEYTVNINTAADVSLKKTRLKQKRSYWFFFSDVMLTSNDSDILVEFSSSVSLSCSSSGSSPFSYRWLNSSSEVTASDGVQIRDGNSTLTIVRVTRYDQGPYTCIVSNPISKIISNVDIPYPTNLPIMEGNSVTLTCDASGSINTREWMKAGQPLSPSDNILFSEDNKTASINPVKRTDSGIYMCRVSNPINSDNVNYNLTVNYGPDGIEIKGPTEIEVGQKFTLTCSADSIPTARKSEYFDSGNYTFTATNYVTGNNTSAVHELSVKAEGSLTPGLSAGAITGIVIAVLMVVGVAVGVAVFFIKKNGFIPNNELQDFKSTYDTRI